MKLHFPISTCWPSALGSASLGIYNTFALIQFSDTANRNENKQNCETVNRPEAGCQARRLIQLRGISIISRIAQHAVDSTVKRITGRPGPNQKQVWAKSLYGGAMHECTAGAGRPRQKHSAETTTGSEVPEWKE